MIKVTTLTLQKNSYVAFSYIDSKTWDRWNVNQNFTVIWCGTVIGMHYFCMSSCNGHYLYTYHTDTVLRNVCQCGRRRVVDACILHHWLPGANATVMTLGLTNAIICPSTLTLTKPSMSSSSRIAFIVAGFKWLFKNFVTLLRLQ